MVFRKLGVEMEFDIILANGGHLLILKESVAAKAGIFLDHFNVEEL